MMATLAAGSDKTAPTYQRGTVKAWDTRIDVRNGGRNGSKVYRHTRVYELRATELVYEIDDCGSFQAGQFTAGQTVEYRVDDSVKNDPRIYIRRDNGKEFKCKMEGARMAEYADSGPLADEH